MHTHTHTLTHTLTHTDAEAVGGSESVENRSELWDAGLENLGRESWQNRRESEESQCSSSSERIAQSESLDYVRGSPKNPQESQRIPQDIKESS